MMSAVVVLMLSSAGDALRQPLVRNATAPAMDPDLTAVRPEAEPEPEVSTRQPTWLMYLGGGALHAGVGILLLGVAGKNETVFTIGGGAMGAGAALLVACLVWFAFESRLEP